VPIAVPLTQALGVMPIPVSPPRSISPAEAAVIIRALSAGPTAAVGPELADSVALLQVTAECECGCDSVDFGADRGGSSIADCMGKSPSGDPVGIIVWGTPTPISALEI
jgi:hypothetical protein